ncbi:LacI family transcriptional regulator [Mesotoga sp. SC_NapDC2]|nr:LacI family transcriptional regulator [Mesotoga sp. SC_NapDC]RIZ60951.1 LacI family transcriptional regulator [Mesotoga sp. SC_NapDC2]
MRKITVLLALIFVLMAGILFGTDVAVLLPGTVEFFSVQRVGLDAAAKEFGLNLIYADAEWDAGKQLSQVENFIARGVDLVLLCAADNMALRTAVTRCDEAGIPLITFTNSIGTDPEGKYPGVISHIGRSEIGSGVVQAEFVEKLFGNADIDIILIEGNPGTTAQRMREEGFLSVAERNPSWSIIEKRPIDGWTKEGTLAFMEAFLQSGRNVDVIACQWWSGAIAASMALKERGITDVVVLGLEYAKELVPYIEAGDVYASTYFSVIEEGYKAVEAAHLYLTGQEVPKFVEIQQVMVTKDNVGDFEPEM